MNGREPAGRLILLALVVALCGCTSVAPVETSAAPALATAPIPPPSLTPVSSSAPSSTAPATHSPQPTDVLSALIVSDGDRVEAVGKVWNVGGTFFICGSTGQFAVLGGRQTCWGVPITGVDPSTLPGWSERDQRSDFVTVRGIWVGGRIAVEEVGPLTHDNYGPRLPPPVPCSAPPGGWDAGVPKEAALRRLSHEISSDLDLYSFKGSDELPPAQSGGPRLRVFWVGTVGDVTAVREHLARIFPYNLCVTTEAYSRAALDAVSDRMVAIVEQKHKPWGPTVDVGWNRVFLQLPVLDAEAAQLIGADADKIELDPLVQKAVP